MATTFDPKFQETEKDKGVEFSTKIYDTGITMVGDRISSIRYPEPGWEGEMIKSVTATLPLWLRRCESGRSKQNNRALSIMNKTPHLWRGFSFVRRHGWPGSANLGRAKARSRLFCGRGCKAGPYRATNTLTVAR
jgi:hypothetical protein